MIPLGELFAIEYPKTLVLAEQLLNPRGTIFISSKGADNGVSARVSDIPGRKKYKSGAITVALKGSVMSAFLQVEDFYIAHQTAVLYPKRKMDDEEKLFYCACLTQNKYRFNYGRQADRTLKSILVPDQIPQRLRSIRINSFPRLDIRPMLVGDLDLTTKGWMGFQLQQLFEVKKGKRLTREDITEGNTPFIGAIDSNNGYRQFIDDAPIHHGNTITVNYNGNGVADAFYQPVPFWASDDVNVLYPKFALNVYIALFIAAIIRLEKYRFSYGRKWNKERMERSEISLPARDGKPDFVFMERYIKSLPFSSGIAEKAAIPKRDKTITK